MPTKERAAAERARRAAPKNGPAKPKARVPTAADIDAEQAATRAMFEALLPLATGARYRALEWLTSWAREQDPGRMEF